MYVPIYIRIVYVYSTLHPYIDYIYIYYVGVLRIYYYGVNPK